MTTNREWLYSLDVADLSDWFDAEHVETEERVLDGDTAALEAKIAELQANWQRANARCIEAYARLERCEKDCEAYRRKFGKCLDYADAIHALMDDEGMA